jgi:hypothetical protein
MIHFAHVFKCFASVFDQGTLPVCPCWQDLMARPGRLLLALQLLLMAVTPCHLIRKLKFISLDFLYYMVVLKIHTGSKKQPNIKSCHLRF